MSSSNDKSASRRSFLRKGAALAVSLPIVSTLESCEKPAAAPAAQAPAAPPAKTPAQEAAEMDAMHEAGVKAFPAKTAGKGNVLIEPKLEGGVKVYELTAKEIQWEVTSGKLMKAWSYNDQVPGPQIRVRQGDRVKIIL
ncbi:MAG TPA: multicopper oxidase domain-containing protein, partial [Gemmatimonadales bacterium]|nr:multicopper oxidase domain-containing protein [Gemmatimonadales bacterium]